MAEPAEVLQGAAECHCCSKRCEQLVTQVSAVFPNGSLKDLVSLLITTAPLSTVSIFPWFCVSWHG